MGLKIELNNNGKGEQPVKGHRYKGHRDSDTLVVERRPK